MQLDELVRVSQSVAATRSRNQKRDALAALLRSLAADERALGVHYLSGRLPQGRVGVGPAALRKAAEREPAPAAKLSLRDVDAALSSLAGLSGKGSAAARAAQLGALFGNATEDESRFLFGLLLGEVRHGALDGVMVEAVAAASGCDAAALRRAFMVSGDLAAVALAALDHGDAALARFRLTLATPLRSMLAQTAESVSDALATHSRLVLDTKMDGARVQVHKRGGEVAVFSRRLHDVTASVPEVVELARDLPVATAILDGEAIALRPDGHPHPFQTTMRRFGRKRDVEALRTTLPLSVFFFDCLHAEGDDLLDRPLRERLARLDAFAGGTAMPRLETADAAAGDAFLAAALRAGHEGIVAKDPESAYDAGKRGGAWLKIKPAHTLDLVVLAAEWGHGRRRGRLSNLHLGARDEEGGGFAMLGKTFKGLTDAMLEWQTQRLLALERRREGHVVYVRPELVVEIAFNEIQTSPTYPCGLALRFARVKTFREDKSPAEADTLATVRSFHSGGRVAPDAR